MSIFSKIAKTAVKQQPKAQVAPEILALQKSVQGALKQNLDNVSVGLSDIAKNQASAMQGLEQLAKNIQATIK